MSFSGNCHFVHPCQANPSIDKLEQDAKRGAGGGDVMGTYVGGGGGGGRGVMASTAGRTSFAAGATRGVEVGAVIRGVVEGGAASRAELPSAAQRV